MSIDEAVPLVKIIQGLLDTPWPDKETDVKKCFEILFEDHPDGELGTLLEKVEHDEKGNLTRVTINKTACKWGRYFSSKYGDGYGEKLHCRFLHEYFLNPILAVTTKAN